MRRLFLGLVLSALVVHSGPHYCAVQGSALTPESGPYAWQPPCIVSESAPCEFPTSTRAVHDPAIPQFPLP